MQYEKMGTTGMYVMVKDIHPQKVRN
jgi:hypothetical protein